MATPINEEALTRLLRLFDEVLANNPEIVSTANRVSEGLRTFEERMRHAGTEG